MAKNTNTEQLKSMTGDASDILSIEETPSTEFLNSSEINEYIVYLKDEEVFNVIGFADGYQVSFLPDETNKNYQDYLAWVGQGNVAEEIAL
jgi:hypothetical protein